MLQLKTCLLLLIISADTFLVLPSSACNGHMNLSQDPTGHFGFSPGEEGSNRPSAGLMICTRTLELPAGHTVLLKLVWLESGSNMSLVCTGDQDKQTLALGDTALLYGCDQNRATLTWSGAGHSSNAFQIFYYVQEEKRSSTETQPMPDSHPNITTPDPATATSEESPFSDVFLDLSGNPTHYTRLTQSTTPPSAAASTDREASLFPGEELNNGPDASGALTRTDIPGRLDFLSTQHSTSIRSRFYPSQNTEFQTVSVSNDAASSGGTYASTELYTNRQNLGYEKNSLTLSSIEPPLDMSSAVLPKNLSGTVDKTDLDLTETRELSGAQITNSPSTQNTERIEESSSHGDYLHTSSREQLSTTGSTENPPITTNGSHTEVHNRTLSIQDSGHTMSMSFERSGYSEESTQENMSTENILGRQLSSQRTSSPSSLMPNLDSVSSYVTERDLTSFQSSASANFASADSTFGESNKKEAKTSPRIGMDLLTTSYFLSDHRTSNELTSLSTEPMSTSSSGESYTMQSNGVATEGLSTMTPYTISPQQTVKTTINSKIFPKTESSTPSSETVTTSTLSQVSHIPYQTHSSKYLSLSTSMVTVHKGEKEATTSIVSTSLTPGSVNHVTTSSQPFLTTVPIDSTTVGQKPKYYIVPDEPVIIKEESFELLLQITVKESTSAWTEGLEEDVALWLEPHLQRAPGFKELLSVWTSGHAVQCLVHFDTKGALQWLPHTGGSSLLERTGLQQLDQGDRSFSDSSITNVTLGGVQEACGWLLQCPLGFTCVFDPRTSNYSCTSVCHSEYCQHHGLCTHHPEQPPVCRCMAGQDFWFMGQRCEVRMTRARLVLSCLGVLSVVVGVVGVLACMAVRRYRALLIQAKMDQTRSSYRRFNHFDELSGRFWLRSCSADSLDNPAFSRSDEILQLRALERPCCYHDDSLSLPSTCPSPGLHIRTIYPHSSQYAWRGSDQSVGDGVLDSGKASDLSVCSWPREPIQWSPFPLLQQLALQRPPAVRVPRTRSYCDGMELVDMNKSWTA